MRDAAGKIINYIALKEDITEQKKAADTLHRSEAHLKAIVENLAECIFVGDREGRLIYMNPEAEEVFGFRQHELEGKVLHDMIHHHYPNGRPFPASDCQNPFQCLNGETIRHHEDVYFRKDGSAVNVVCSQAPITVNGVVSGTVLTVQDITEQRKLELHFRQSQKMETFGQLAGGVAHDFNNILAVIQIQAGLLRLEAGMSEQQIESAKEIEKATKRAANLTRQLLLFSRKQVLQARDLDLNEIVANVTKMLQRIVGEDIAMQLRLAPGALGIHADAGMIDQILLNLAVNARDAMPKGGQLIIETSTAEFDELAAKQMPQARVGSFACLTVSDAGCGIAADIQPRIFEPFFTTKDIGKGTGLGLATVFGIVQQHQGWINVQSEVGRGTTFLIFFPRLSKFDDRSHDESQRMGMPRGTETILLVEDDSVLRVCLRNVLSELGYRILEAPSGIFALGIWEQYHEEIDLLFTDLVMPDGINGKELGHRLLAENPQLKIIYTSGYSKDIVGKDFQLLEGFDFLPKPFQTYQLAQAVRNRLDLP